MRPPVYIDGRVVELVDTQHSKCCFFGSDGSSPSSATIYKSISYAFYVLLLWVNIFPVATPWQHLKNPKILPYVYVVTLKLSHLNRPMPAKCKSQSKTLEIVKLRI